MYLPKPIDTTNVVIPSKLLNEIERLAENAHDIWAQKRFRNGWKLEKKEMIQKKEHPDLIPYTELSDEEKEFDRATVLETIKAIIALGFNIEKTK